MLSAEEIDLLNVQFSVLHAVFCLLFAPSNLLEIAKIGLQYGKRQLFLGKM
jgi:hypothetical protein